jgi:hypothetical protein
MNKGVRPVLVLLSFQAQGVAPSFGLTLETLAIKSILLELSGQGRGLATRAMKLSS